MLTPTELRAYLQKYPFFTSSKFLKAVGVPYISFQKWHRGEANKHFWRPYEKYASKVEAIVKILEQESTV